MSDREFAVAFVNHRRRELRKEQLLSNPAPLRTRVAEASARRAEKIAARTRTSPVPRSLDLAMVAGLDSIYAY